MGVERYEKRYTELVSPSDRFFLQPGLDISIDSFVTFQSTIDIVALKSVLASSLVKNCPRLRSILTTDDRGRLQWKELPSTKIDDHVIVVPVDLEEEEKKNDSYINDYLASLPSLSPLKRNTSPWEVHVLPKRRRSLVLRFHHVLGDCVSLLGLLLASCAMADEIPLPLKNRERPLFSERVISGAAGFWRIMKTAPRTIHEVSDYVMLAIRRHEDLMSLSRGKSLDRSSRKLASLELCMNDMVAVKKKLNAKINDVFVGIISEGIAKYLEYKSTNETLKDAKITGLVVANIRGEGSKDILRSIRQGKRIKWGNKVGYFVLPIQVRRNSDDPLSYARQAKQVLDQKKRSFEAQFTGKINSLAVSLFNQKAMDKVNYKIRHNISLVLSNIVGPSEPLMLANNLVTKMGVTLGSLPAALDVHMISYNGKASLQFLVAEDIIPDPEILSMFVQEALRDMKAKI